MVEVELPEGDPSIQYYNAKVKDGSPDQSCSILSCVPPLQCKIHNVTLGAAYTVEVTACVPGDVCSTSIKQSVQTSVRACLPGLAGCNEPASTKP